MGDGVTLVDEGRIRRSGRIGPLLWTGKGSICSGYGSGGCEGKEAEDAVGGDGGGFGGGDVEPVGGELMAEEGALAFDELAGFLFDEVDGGGEGEFAAEVGGDLAVADGLEGGGVGREGEVEEAAGFADKVLGEHGVDAGVDALVEVGRGTVEAEDGGGRGGGGGVPGGAEARGGLAGEAGDFDGADESAPVMGVDGGGEGGVDGLEFAEEVWEGGGLEGGAEVGSGCGGVPEAFDPGFEVEAGAAAEDGGEAAGMDRGDGLVGEFEEAGGAEGFTGVGDVEEVVRDEGAFGRGRFGRADVHAAIDLHGVEGDDFGVEEGGEFEGDGGFAGGGGAGEEEGGAVEVLGDRGKGGGWA